MRERERDAELKRKQDRFKNSFKISVKAGLGTRLVKLLNI